MCVQTVAEPAKSNARPVKATGVLSAGDAAAEVGSPAVIAEEAEAAGTAVEPEKSKRETESIPVKSAAEAASVLAAVGPRV